MHTGFRACRRGKVASALTTSLDAGTLRGLGADWVAGDLAGVSAEIWERS